LAWEDAGGAVWLTYNDLAWLAQRHGLGEASHAPVAALTAAMVAMAASVARPDTHDLASPGHRRPGDPAAAAG
jgi:hypothetical protein